MPGPLPEYPSVPGNKFRVIQTVAGPTAYAQVAVGSPPTGGQVILAKDVGLVGIEFAQASLSDDGQFEVNVIFDNNPQSATTQVRLIWVVAATGAQVAGAVNLSARTVRIAFEGR